VNCLPDEQDLYNDLLERAGIDPIRHHQPDLTNGTRLDLIAALRAHDKTRHAWIIVLSAAHIQQTVLQPSALAAMCSWRNPVCWIHSSPKSSGCSDASRDYRLAGFARSTAARSAPRLR
jgi:hypothetical protein